ncbi:CoA transferase [Kitasatospora sp. NBC_01302]|uniref:CoA transferase n=1 Tax=Kitasatospora sp. NBC_01302 TaxID=2903575 RepID=UPI002E160103|nr:CoA transferase [Kitasatospora sp. NBC_01302]
MPRSSANWPAVADGSLLRRSGSTPSPTAPLTGVPLATAGTGTAVRLATRHLLALGCTAAPPRAAERSCGSAAGWLGLGGSGAPGVDCVIDWAGPVRLPLADEAGVQAACGISAVHGRRYGRPTPLGIDYASAAAGVLAVQGLLAARYAGLHGHPVREVRTSVAGAALVTVGQYIAAATADEAAEFEERAEPARAPGAVDGPGVDGPPFSSVDGVRFEIEALEPGQWLAFWSRLGVDRRVIGRGWPPFQLRYATARCSLPAELCAATAALPYHELAAAATAAGVGILPVRTGGPAGHPGPPWRIAPAPGAVGPPGPRGEQRAAGPPGPPGRPLDGVVVVELTRRLQGPLASRLLALLGARVVRVEPLGGDPLRGVPPMTGEVSARFHALNHGKQVVEADPRSPGGQRTIRELVDTADVFLHNLAPGKAEAFGLGAERLLAERPGLVHAWASGWGEVFGAKAPFGTDYPVQAHSGLAALVTPPGRPAAPSLMTITDVFGGLISAEAVLAALLARTVTGRGQRVETSLWSAAVTLLDTASPACASAAPAPGPAARPATPAELAADPRFADALHRDGCLLPRAPWEFHR